MVLETEHLEVAIPSAGVELSATLGLPAAPTGFVLLAHVSGCGRFSSRNRFVAGTLEEAGFATLLVDLLTPEEDLEDVRTSQLRFDVGLLGERLAGVVAWAQKACLSSLPLGLFAVDAGAAAALLADARSPGRLAAIVCRSGRTDLAGGALAQVRAPTLLVVGGTDPEAMRLGQEALSQMGATAELRVIPTAGHLFEEPGALAALAAEAAAWFRSHLHASAVPAATAAPSPSRAR
jgi:dienelactone hydrolase